MVDTLQLVKTVVADGNSATMDTGTLTGDLDVLRVVVEIEGGGSGGCRMRFNGDSGSNYRRLFSENGGSKDGHGDGANDNIANMVGRIGRRSYSINTIYNISGKESSGYGHCITDGGNTGSANAPTRMEYAFKWANTAQITSIQIVSDSTNWASGSTLNVYAYSRADSSTSDEKTTLTNVPVGTRYEETDTRKIYRRKGALSSSDADHSFDFSSSSGWTLDTHHTISGGTLNFDSDSSLDGVRATYDLGTALSSTWVLRWKWSFTTLNLPNDSNYKWHFGISNTASKNSSSHDWITADMDLRNSSGYQERKIEAKVSDDQTHQSGDYVPSDERYHITNSWSGTDYYCELIKTGITTGSFKLNIYSDSNFSSLLNTAKHETSTKNPTGLKYIWSGIDDYSGAGRSPLEWDGKIDNIEIYDGVTSLDAQWKERGSA